MYSRELIASVAHKSAADTKLTQKIIHTFFETLSENLAKGERIVIPGYATFERVERPARKGRNPRTGKPIDLPAAYGVKISAGETLKRRVRQS